MSAPLTDSLCTRCGLCCDGSLFADVELAGPAEATALAILGLRIEDDDAERELLVQPCSALRGRRCGIYAHRPGCCRTFECRLLADTRRGALSLEQARAHVGTALTLARRARQLLRDLGDRQPGLPLAERAAEALGAARSADPRRDALAATVGALTELVRVRFLGRGRPGRGSVRT